MTIKEHNNIRTHVNVTILPPIPVSSDEDSSEVFISTDRECHGSYFRRNWKVWGNRVKITSLVSLLALCSCFLMSTNVKVQQMHQISIPKKITKDYLIMEEPKDDKIRLMLDGALIPPYYGNLSFFWMDIWIEMVTFEHSPKQHSIEKPNILFKQNISSIWHVPIASENLLETVPQYSYKKTFDLNTTEHINGSFYLLEINFETNLNANFPINFGYNLEPIDTKYGIIYAALILAGLYFLIIFELIHRTLAAMLASTMSLAVLAALNARPTMTEIISWINVETLLLLFSMMILVTVLGETGIFDYTSVLAYKITNGKIWPLINILCVIAAFLSCLLDNVTTVLLITPVTIKLCEIMRLNPVPVLIYMLIFTNIGGAITPVGDPPNVIIASNADVLKAGINFGSFTLHMGIGALLAVVFIYIQLRYTLKDVESLKYPEPEIQELRREIQVWQRAVASVSSYSRDEENVKESLIKQSATLIGKLKLKQSTQTLNDEHYTLNLKDLEREYPIRDKILLLKSGITLLLVISVFFLHSIPALSKLGLGWTALLGALLLLLLYDKEYLEGIFSRVEWSTLLFFASLFILMEALSHLGLIEWICVQTQNVILSVERKSRLTVAIILILWVSGFASAFVDNLPLTTMMIRIATNLADNRELGLPLQPLVWALSFGACFGGNATLVGSSCNIVCAGVAEQHGYRFSFLEFMKVGFPVVITSLSVITFYLIICHVLLGWN